MGQLTSAGLGSGLNVNAIIEALTNAERAPITLRLNRQEAGIQAKQAGLSGLSSALSTLKTAAEKLDASGDFKLRKTTLSKSEFVSVSASGTASAGQFSVEVVQLAKGSQRESGIIAGGSAATFGAGKLTFTVGAKNFSVDVGGTDTLTTIRNKINGATGNIGVSATIVTSDTGTKLVFDSTITGAGNDLVITNDNAALDAISTTTVETRAAQSAQIRVNGALTTSTTNTFSSAVQDVTITALKQNAAAETTEVTVANDTAGVKKLIQDFVKAYNAAVDEVGKLTTNTKEASGPLAADGATRSIMSRLRGLIGTSVASVSGDYNSLASIGISTDQKGKLEIKESRLDSALGSKLEDVVALFSNSDGIANTVKSYIDTQAGTNGVLSTRQKSLETDLKRITAQREQLELRIEKMTTRLRNQYASLDSLVSRMNSTGQFISQNLAKTSSSKS